MPANIRGRARGRGGCGDAHDVPLSAPRSWRRRRIPSSSCEQQRGTSPACSATPPPTPPPSPLQVVPRCCSPDSTTGGRSTRSSALDPNIVWDLPEPVWPYLLREYILETAETSAIRISCRKSQKRFQGTPRFKLLAVIVRIQQFQRSNERSERGDHSV